MHRRLGQVAAILLLCVWMLGPVLEQVDPWDIFPDAGDGIILLLTALAALLGLSLCFALLAIAVPIPAGTLTPPSSPAFAPILPTAPLHTAGRTLLQPLRV